MVSMNRSFLYGIGFASITWAISLYLYLNLTSSEHPTHSPLPKGAWSPSIEDGHGKGASRFVKPDKDFIKKLQPVFRKAVSNDLIDKELDELGMVRDVDDQSKKDEGYKLHAFNVLVSDRLDLHRDVPDTRNRLCKNVNYTRPLPTASVIICFYNEHYTTLLRTLHSIVDRTPADVLQEILLVDDFSDSDSLHRDLQKYADKNFAGKVQVMKTERREGLIRARLFGSRRAKGDVLIFLDSHIEVNVAWIEPLLERIKENRTFVAMPVIDIINADTFAYSSSPLVRGGFNWGLHFKWENLPKGTLVNKSDFIKPIKSPTMAGGLFAIDRKYFEELGEYDAGMNIWGGENLEISFRIWMCGGHLDLLPCSRVGHVFRQRRPYGSPDGEDTMLHNSLRVAHVWMDQYKDYFLDHRADAKKINYGDVTSRLQLRKELRCRDFDWYLKNVYPELTLPSDNQERLRKKWAALESDKYQPWHSRKRNYVNEYQIRLSNTSLCLSSKDVSTKGSYLVVKTCMRGKNQIWYETDKHELVLGQLLCLQAGKPGPIMYKCHEMGGDQEWKHKGDNNSPIYNMAAGTCLGPVKNESKALVAMKLCTGESFTSWDIIPINAV